jgi:hypothetical protein
MVFFHQHVLRLSVEPRLTLVFDTANIEGTKKMIVLSQQTANQNSNQTERKHMNKEFEELTKQMTQSITHGAELKTFGVGLAAIALACLAFMNSAKAQTSLVCDPAGDASSTSGKGGPAIPAWLDIVQSEVSDAGSDIHFTLTLNAAIPATPAWDHVADGGQLWWGWRIVDDLANDFQIKDGCVKATGSLIPAGYFVDLIWDVTSSSFRARLLDDTTCVQNDVPFVFSSDRTQVTLVVSKSLLTNPVTIPNPNAFQHFASTLAWKPNQTGNNAFFTLDLAPNQDNNGLVAVPWSASQNSMYFCQ